ncbi:hypothetical protein AN619_12960 [Thermotalea metallivorans]|uniref:Translational regulator CsrA n=1 Tax=Thermotalea metallivorans TaxID=520762 RepID=A0A140L713_9FIRM|nr:hypothetical protein AN619_12960 [Thermotalea metallivorans]
MLVLSRKKGESVIIDGMIEVQILDMDEGKVKLGITAPKKIEIFRKEVYEEIIKENMEAANIYPDMTGLKNFFQKK